MKRLIAIVTAIVLLLSVGSAFAQTPGWTENKEPITLTWFVGVSWWGTGWDTPNAKYITEKTGVNIEYITPMDPNMELNNMMTTKDLPDIISLGFWEPTFNKLWQGGYVWALDELAELYDPYFLEVAGEACLSWYKQADGHTYCIPNEAYTQGDMERVGATNANQSFLVRKDLYEEMGSPDLRTPEGFLDALRLLKEEYSVYKGLNMTPMAIQNAAGYGLTEYLQSMLAIPYLEEDGVTLHDRSTDETYIKWLKVFREAYSEGLLTEDILVGDTSGTEKGNNGAYFINMSEYTGLGNTQRLLYEKDPDSIYIPVYGPANDNLDKPNAFPGSMSGWMPVFISKNCENPDRAIQFLAYLASDEGQRDVFLGQEGVTWDYVDGKPTFHDDVIEMMNADGNAAANLGIMDTYWQMRNPVVVFPWRPEQPFYYQDMVDWCNANCDYSAGIFKNLDPTGNDDAGNAWTAISADWSQVLTELILAESEEEFDEIWDAFIERRDEMGYDLVLEFRQNTYNERLSKQ